MTLLFQAASGAETLSISLNGPDGGDFVELLIAAEGKAVAYQLAAPLPRADADARPFEIAVNIGALPDAILADTGLLGLKPAGDATRLHGLRILVRPSEASAPHCSEAPYFALYIDWAIEASVADESEFSSGKLAAGAVAELIVTTGFSCIHPPTRMPSIAARAIQLRIDLDCLAATTGWFPLPLVDLSSPFDLGALRAWFGALVGAISAPKLPDWDIDLRIAVALPFGLRFRESYILLTPDGSGHAIEARARGLILDWKGGKFTHGDADLSLFFDGKSWIFRAVLLAAQAPAKDAPYPGEDGASLQTISLPFGALSLTAAAWRAQLGLFASGGTSASDTVRICPELIIEIADAALGSSLADGPLWQSDAVRLHLRGHRLLTCTDETALFQGFDQTNWLALYANDHKPKVPALSGIAAKEGGPASGPKAFTFLDGDFDPDSHMSLLWEQNGAEIFRAIAAVIPGLSEKQDGAAGEKQLVALELARFDTPGGRDLQARLEWRPAAATPPTIKAPAGPGAGPGEICSTEADGVHTLILPPGPTPGPVDNPALRLDLPLVDLRVAAPGARSILFYAPADEPASLALLYLYAGGSPILQAKLDLMLADGKARELLPTNTPASVAAGDAGGAAAPAPAPPFIDLRLASGTASQALAVVSWREGDRPQILRAYEGEGPAFRSLIPDVLPGLAADCSACPTDAPARAAPLRLEPARFRAPDPFAAGDGWSLALQIAANRALRSFLPPGGVGDGLIDFTVERVCIAPRKESDDGARYLPRLRIHAVLTVKLNLLGGGDEVSGKALFEFDPEDMALRMLEGGVLAFKSEVEDVPDWLKSRDTEAKEALQASREFDLFGLGFDAVFLKPPSDPVSDEAEFLTLDLSAGRFVIGLADGVSCYLRYADLGEDGLIFKVSELSLGAGGLDLEAELAGGSLKLPGLKTPFLLDRAALSIMGSRVRRLSVGAKGNLPEIMGSAPVSATLTLAQPPGGGRVELEELACTLEGGDKPIRASGVRFEFKITQLSLRYLRSDAGKGGRQFFFEVTGSAEFKPDGDEFVGGLLENLKSARCEFTRAPLSDDFIDHLELIAELNEPVTFDVFKVFRMEIRSIGFSPKHDFEGGEDVPAIIIAGQCEFADTGDVISAEIDFHRLYLGMPKKGNPLPQVEFKDLRVEIRAADGFRIGGAVRVHDEDLRKGFKGDGFVQLPGFPEIGAAFAFMELRRSSDDSWKRAWFIALEARGISYQLGALPIYLRQAGLGFGYRYTSLLLRTQPEDQTLKQLVDYLLKALDQHQTLAHIDSWTEDLEESGSGRWTVAAEAVFTLGSSQTDPLSYNAKDERELRTILLQLMLALNPNGLIAGAKLWFPVSYDDLMTNADNMRQSPLAKGFVHFSPRSQRLLAYATKSPKPYYGPKGALTDLARTVLDPVPFECAVLVEPGRLRGEIGWPDRLVFTFDLGPMKIECRGGILYAVENNTAVYGLYFSAHGRLVLGGSAGGGSLGLSVSAETKVNFAARLMIAQPLLKPLGGYVYAQVGLDLSVRFSVEAWFRFKAGFVKITLRLSFSISLQIVIALEIGLADGSQFGFRGRATVVISVFGRGLRASISARHNEGGLDKARDFVAPYMSSMLEPGKVPPVPGETMGVPVAAAADRAERVPAPGLRAARDVPLAAADLRALRAEPAPANDTEPAAPADEAVADEASADGAAAEGASAGGVGADDVSTDRADADAAAAAAPDECFAFATIPLAATTAAGERHWLLWIMPTIKGDGFYPLPPDKDGVWATLANIPAGTDLFALNAANVWVPVSAANSLDLYAKPLSSFPVEGTADPLKLRQAVAGCYEPLGACATAAFPFDFEGSQGDLHRVAADERAKRVVEDDRIVDGPRDADPVLNPTHPYDQALGDVIARGKQDEAGGGTLPDSIARGEEARANQGFLLSAFRDDIAAYVKTASAAPPVRGGRAEVWDSGMVLLLRAAELPDWASLREQLNPPSLAWGAPGAQGDAQPLQPLVDPGAVSFAPDRLQLVRPIVAHFDEQRLALDWAVDWKDGDIKAAPGIGIRVEDHLSHYRVELYSVGGGEAPLLRRDVLPANLLAEGPAERERIEARGEDGATSHSGGIELRPAYSFTIRTDELFPTAAHGGQVLRQVVVVITPVDQYGGEGRSFTATAAQEPSYTPLPAEEPRLELGANDKGALKHAVIRWREPALPNQDGIASTTHWDLIIRKAPHVALGPYPLASAAPGGRDEGPGAARDLQPGDFIARIAKHEVDILVPEGSETFGSPAYRLEIERGTLLGSGVKWLDHLERPFPTASGTTLPALVRLRDSFLNKRSVLEEGGHAWQLYLRAAAVGAKGKFTCSSIAPVHAYATIPGERGEPPRQLPLAQLEWPEPVSEAWLNAPEILHGPRHAPTLDDGWDGAAPPALDYLPTGDQQRVVSVQWSGYGPAQGGAARPAIAAYAGFRLFEAREEGLTGADLIARRAMTPDLYSTEIARFEAGDPALAAALPASLAQTELWQSWGPAASRLLRWRADPKETRLPRSEEIESAWYSFADAALSWPPKDDKAYEVSDAPAFARGNLHPFLGRLVIDLESWAKAAFVELEITAGMPDETPDSRIGWMKRCGPAKDPAGWAALWHLGLALEIAARDAQTGEPMPQERLRAICTEYLKGLPTDEYERWQPYLAIDFPLKANDGLAPGPVDISLADAALDRLLIALRPCVIPKEVYFWVSTVAEGTSAPAVKPQPWVEPDGEGYRPDGAHWIPLGEGDAAAGYLSPGADGEPFPELGTLLTPGRSLLFKLPSHLAEKLEAAMDKQKTQIAELAWTDRPLCLGEAQPRTTTDEAPSEGAKNPAWRAMPLWPHGRFAPSTGRIPSNSDALQRFLELLNAAPLAARDRAPDADGNIPAVPAMDEKETEEVIEAYCLWAARFFASAPLPGPGHRARPFTTANSSVAALRSEVVEMIAPDADGSYHVNRLVTWQWATARSIAIAGIGRYDRLIAAMAGPKRDTLPSAPTTVVGTPVRAIARSFALDRIRRLEPPQLMGERIVRGDDRRDYHEIALALHEEEQLAGHNSLVDFKLQFRGLGFRFHRRFAFAGWAHRIAAPSGNDPVTAVPDQSWYGVPGFEAGDADFLARYPAARFGATSLHLPAEPFFYESTIDLRAASVTLESDMLSYKLAQPRPAPCRPEGRDPLIVFAENVEIDDPLFFAWRDALAASGGAIDAIGDPVLFLDLRFPRLFESLEGEQRAAEQNVHAFGGLPDPDMRVQFAEVREGTLAPICMLRPETDANAPEPFAVTALRDGLSFDHKIFIEPAWHEGVTVLIAIMLDRDPVAASPPLADVTIAQQPLLEAEIASLFAPDHLPAWGPLAALAPLALRLSKTAAGHGVAVQYPYDAPMTLARPLSAGLAHSGAGGGLRPSTVDLGVALRLLLDPERVAAAKAATYEGEEPPRALLTALEDHGGIACRVVAAGAITAASWDAWQEARLAFWALAEEDGSWQSASKLPEDDVYRLIAGVAEWTAASQAALTEFLALPLPNGAVASDVATIKEMAVLAADLAAGWFEKAALARSILPAPDTIGASAQRGNDAQTPWGGRAL